MVSIRIHHARLRDGKPFNNFALIVISTQRQPFPNSLQLLIFAFLQQLGDTFFKLMVVVEDS